MMRLGVHLSHERPTNRLSQMTVKGQELLLIVWLGKYSLEIKIGGIRTKD